MPWLKCFYCKHFEVSDNESYATCKKFNKKHTGRFKQSLTLWCFEKKYSKEKGG